MSITASQVLKKLQEVSNRHQTNTPPIGIDSLQLMLQIKRVELMPLLEELNKSGYIDIRQDKITITSTGLEVFC